MKQEIEELKSKHEEEPKHDAKTTKEDKPKPYVIVKPTIPTNLKPDIDKDSCK